MGFLDFLGNLGDKVSGLFAPQGPQFSVGPGLDPKSFGIAPTPSPTPQPQTQSILSSLLPHQVVSPLPSTPYTQIAAFPTPTHSPSPAPATPYVHQGATPYFNYEPYRVNGDYVPPQPPKEWAHSIMDIFPNEATKAALTMATENGAFNPQAYNYNTGATGMYHNSQDYGPMQLNDVTMQDYQRRYPNTMKNIGVNNVEDLKDLIKSLEFSKLIANTQGWGAWYGPRNKGFDTTK